MRLDVLATPPLRLVFRNRNLFCAWDLHALGHEGRDLLGRMSTRPLLVMTKAPGDRRPSGRGQPSPSEAKALQTEATSEGSLQTEDISEGSLASATPNLTKLWNKEESRSTLMGPPHRGQ